MELSKRNKHFTSVTLLFLYALLAVIPSTNALFWGTQIIHVNGKSNIYYYIFAMYICDIMLAQDANRIWDNFVTAKSYEVVTW